MAKAKTGLIAIGTVITGGAEYTNGQEIKGDLDKAEVEWLIANGAAKQSEVVEAEAEAAETKAP